MNHIKDKFLGIKEKRNNFKTKIMQKIFTLDPESKSFVERREEINKFIEKNGTIISVTPNKVSTGSTSAYGSWLIVADDGKTEEKLML